MKQFIQLTISFVLLVFSVSTTHAQTLADLVKDDIKALNTFMIEYKQWEVEVKNSGYEPWGYTVDNSSYAVLEKLVTDADKALKRNDINSARDLLHDWSTKFDKYDSNVTKKIADANYRYLNEELIIRLSPLVEAWLQQNRDSGYDVSAYEPEWVRLKNELIETKATWPAKQQQNYSWPDRYNAWADRLEKELHRQYEANLKAQENTSVQETQTTSTEASSESVPSPTD